MSSRRAADELEQTLRSLLPTHPSSSPLPAALLDLAHTLLLQSRSRAGRLKPEEEAARCCAACEIACQRLKTRLDLPKIDSRPPCAPRTYKRLYHFLDQTLAADVSASNGASRKSRSGRGESPISPQSTPRKVGGKATTPASKSQANTGRMSGGGRKAMPQQRASHSPTPSKRRKLHLDQVEDVEAPVVLVQRDVQTPSKGRAGEVLSRPELVEGPGGEVLTESDEAGSGGGGGGDDDDDDDDEGEGDEDAEDSGDDDDDHPLKNARPISSMEARFDWLSEERRAQHARWKAKIMRRIEAIEAQQAAATDDT